MNGTQSPPSVGSASDRYLFKNYLDAVFYQIVYLVFPLYSLLVGAFFSYESVYLTALPCCVGVIYDGVFRLDRHAYRQKMGKLIVIIAVNTILSIYTIGALLYFVATNVNPWLRVYLLLLTAPLLGGYDFLHMLYEDWRSRRK